MNGTREELEEALRIAERTHWHEQRLRHDLERELADLRRDIHTGPTRAEVTAERDAALAELREARAVMANWNGPQGHRPKNCHDAKPCGCMPCRCEAFLSRPSVLKGGT